MIDNHTKRRFASIKQEAEKYHPTWRELCSYMIPFCGSFNERSTDKPSIDYLKVLDCDPNIFVVWLAAGMMSGMTNPSREWFALGTDKAVWGETPEEAEYLKKRKERIENTLHKSGVYLTFLKMYTELPVVGTYVFLVEEDPINGARTIPFTIGETYLGVGPNGRPDTFGCTHWLTPREMVANFGDAVPEHIRQRVDTASEDERIAVYQLIEPNNNRDINALDAKNKAYRSVYWTPGSENYLRVSGYDVFPVICPRWDIKNYNSIWGTGPGWQALGAIKSLQKITADEYLAVELGVKPPLLADNSIAYGQINIKPGGVSWRKASGTGQGLAPLFNTPLDLNAAEVLVQKVKQSIKSQFFTDVVMMMLSEPKQNQTATEVNEKIQERLAIMGPVLERLVEECHKPLIELIDHINEMQGKYDDLEAPESLQGTTIKITFNSVFHEAQKASGTRSIEMLMEQFANFAQIKPEILDMLNADKIGKQIADKLSQTEVLATDEEIASIRASRQQEQAMAQEQQQEAMQADNISKLASAEKLQKEAQGIDLTGGY